MAMGVFRYDNMTTATAESVRISLLTCSYRMIRSVYATSHHRGGCCVRQLRYPTQASSSGDLRYRWCMESLGLQSFCHLLPWNAKPFTHWLL